MFLTEGFFSSCTKYTVLNGHLYLSNPIFKTKLWISMCYAWYVGLPCKAKVP